MKKNISENLKRYEKIYNLRRKEKNPVQPFQNPGRSTLSMTQQQEEQEQDSNSPF